MTAQLTPDDGRAFALWRAAALEWSAYTRRAIVEGLRTGTLTRSGCTQRLRHGPQAADRLAMTTDIARGTVRVCQNASRFSMCLTTARGIAGGTSSSNPAHGGIA